MEIEKTKVAVVACDNYSSLVVKESLVRAFKLLGGIKDLISPGKLLIKPNLCLPQPPDTALTTHPEIIKQLIYLCKEYVQEIVVGDNPVGDATEERLDQIWEICGMQDVLKNTRGDRSLLNKQIQEYQVLIEEKSYRYFISQEVLDANLVINVPKFKTHSLMTFTGAIKNLYGLLPGNSKKRLHFELPEHNKFAQLLCDIYQRIRPGLTVMDAVLGIEGDGPGTKGERRKIGLILVSTDGVAIDTVATKIMGISPHMVPTIPVSQKLQIGETELKNIEIVGETLTDYIQEDFKIPQTSVYHKDITRKLFSLSRSYLQIDSGKCVICYLCHKNCPTSAIYESGKRLVIRHQDCIGCMTCHEICPQAAIEVKRPLLYDQLKALSKSKCGKESGGIK